VTCKKHIKTPIDVLSFGKARVEAIRGAVDFRAEARLQARAHIVREGAVAHAADGVVEDGSELGSGAGDFGVCCAREGDECCC
jgi:hypothetical protein